MDTKTRKRNLESNLAEEYDKSGIRKAKDVLEREIKKAMIGGAIARKGAYKVQTMDKEKIGRRSTQKVKVKMTQVKNTR